MKTLIPWRNIFPKSWRLAEFATGDTTSIHWFLFVSPEQWERLTGKSQFIPWKPSRSFPSPDASLGQSQAALKGVRGMDGTEMTQKWQRAILKLPQGACSAFLQEETFPLLLLLFFIPRFPGPNPAALWDEEPLSGWWQQIPNPAMGDHSRSHSAAATVTLQKAEGDKGWQRVTKNDKEWQGVTKGDKGWQRAAAVQESKRGDPNPTIPWDSLGFLAIPWDSLGFPWENPLSKGSPK